MEESNRDELRRDTLDPVAHICLRISDSLMIDDVQTVARLIKSCQRHIDSFLIKYSINATPGEMRRQLDLLTLFGCEMKGARNIIRNLTLECSDTGHGETPEDEDAIARSNAFIDALGPFLQSKTIIGHFCLEDSNADAHGIRAVLGFFSYKFESLKWVEFSNCPNFGYDAVQVLIELSRKAKHQWWRVSLTGVPVGNVEIELLLKRLNTEELWLMDIPLDDVGAEMVSRALHSASTEALESLSIVNCPFMTARGATMIEKSVYDNTSLQSVIRSSHTIQALTIDVVDEEVWRVIGKYEFRKRFDPNHKKGICPSFAMLKVMTYIKNQFIPSEVAAIPPEMLSKLLKTCSGLGDLDLFFRILHNKDPAQWISSCSRFGDGGVGENGQARADMWDL